jgi:hypothetical protein
MKFIPEQIIDSVVAETENTGFLEKEWQKLAEENPSVIEFISGERLELLTREESELLEFLVLVIYSSVAKALGKKPVIQGRLLEEYEDKNWEVWNEQGAKSTKRAIDFFFENYPQEDLLAFVEDSLGDDEEVVITNVGIEMIMVTAKSLIDTLHDLNA